MSICTSFLRNGNACDKPVADGESRCSMHARYRNLSFQKHIAKEKESLTLYGEALFGVWEAEFYNRSIDEKLLAEHQYTVAWREWEDMIYTQTNRLVANDPDSVTILEHMREQVKQEDEQGNDRWLVRDILNPVQNDEDYKASMRVYARQIEAEILQNLLVALEEENRHPFVQDPIGDIHLRAFSHDAQNVHRSSIQNANRATIQKIVQRSIPENQHTLSEIKEAFEESFAKERVQPILNELHCDISRNVQCFDYSYKDILDRVWASIRSHESKKDLVLRLLQELEDGQGKCSSGKMCRLLTVLQGYDSELTRYIYRDAFQSKIATLVSLPQEERELQANMLFEEYSIPENERSNWLGALLEFVCV